MNKQVWGVCAECGKYHINPVTKAEVNLDQDITTLLEYTETLMKENTELEAVGNKMDAEISILTRELREARQEIDNLTLKLRIAELEKMLLERKNNDWLQPNDWPQPFEIGDVPFARRDTGGRSYTNTNTTGAGINLGYVVKGEK